MIDFDLWVQYLSQNLLWYSVKRHIYQYPCICHKSLLIKGSAYFNFGKFIWCQFYIMKGYPSVYEFVLKNEIKLFLKSLLELILWNTVSYVLCFLLVFYIAQVSAFLLYPPLCYVSLHVFVNNLSVFFWYCHEDCDFLFLCVADCYGVFLIMWSVESQMLTSGLADDLLLFVLDFISFFLFPEINIFVDRKSQ